MKEQLFMRDGQWIPRSRVQEYDAKKRGVSKVEKKIEVEVKKEEEVEKKLIKKDKKTNKK